MGALTSCSRLCFCMECWEVRIICEEYFCRLLLLWKGIQKGFEWNICLHIRPFVPSVFFICPPVFFSPTVLLIPAKCGLISVCVEDDRDLRVDCQIEPKPNTINSYEFSWSTGTKESLIHTNVSGSSPDSQFSGKSQVEELEPHGYRMTLTGFTDTLPHNTTYMCKISGVPAIVTVEKRRWIHCVVCMCGPGGVSMRLSEWETYTT